MPKNAAPEKEKVSLTEFAICEHCGIEMHRGKRAWLTIEDNGYKNYTCLTHNGEDANA